MAMLHELRCNVAPSVQAKFRGDVANTSRFFVGFWSSGFMNLGPKFMNFMNLGVNLGKLRGELRWQRCQDLGSHVDFGLS